MGSTANAINATASSNLTFDFQKDFAPITMVATTPNVLVVNPTLGIKSVKDLIEYAKKNPGMVNFGSSGPGTSTHLALESSRSRQGRHHECFLYREPAGDQRSFDKPHPDLISPTATVMPHVNQGKLTALATTGARRSDIVPDLPTISEAGVPGYETVLWFGLLAPAETPPAIVDQLNSAIKKAMGSREVAEALRKYDVEAATSTQQEFNQYIGAEIKRWGDAVRAIKATSGDAPKP